MPTLQHQFRQVFKQALILSIAITLTFTRVGYAGNCANADNVNLDDPKVQLLEIVCSFEQIISITYYATASFFVIMLMIGAIKLSLSQGDVKAIESGKSTITWAVIGFIIVISAGTIYQILLGIMGVNSNLTLKGQLSDFFSWLDQASQ